MPLSGGAAMGVGASAVEGTDGAMNAPLFPDGCFAARRPPGQHHRRQAFRLAHGCGHAAALAAKVDERATSLVVYYKSQLLLAKQSGQPAPASGWITAVGYAPGRGLFAAITNNPIPDSSAQGLAQAYPLLLCGPTGPLSIRFPKRARLPFLASLRGLFSSLSVVLR